MNTKPDEQLVLAIREGNVLAYEELVKRYQRGLYVFVFRIIHNEDAAKDIVLESLFKVYQNIDKIDVKRKFLTYVFEIAKNAAISELRRQKYNVSLEEIVDVQEEESFVEELYRSDMAQQIRQEISKLSSKHQQVIRLYYYEELSYEEISAKLKVPLNTVRTYLRRAKIQLKHKLLTYEQ